MTKFEQILKANGFTDEEIVAHASLDPKVKAAVEASYGAVEGKLTAQAEDLKKFQDENTAWAEWNEKHGKPTLELYEREAVEAKATAAGLEARLKEAEKQGYAPRREGAPAPVTPTPTTEAFDPKKHKLVTEDDIRNYADMEGRAIALANDLSEEYRMLTGKSLIEYSTSIDGRTVRGLSALRQEAITAKKPLDTYITEKFDFNAKRQAVSDARAKAAEDAIRADEKSKVIAQYGNPETRQMLPSKDPFIPRPTGGEGAKQPWEIPAQERTRARVDRGLQNQMKSQVN